MTTEVKLNYYDPTDIAGSIAYWCWRTERISIENGFTRADQASVITRLSATLVPIPYVRLDADQWVARLHDVWERMFRGYEILTSEEAQNILQQAIEKDSHSWREWEDTDYRLLAVVHRDWDNGELTPLRTKEDMRAWIAESEDIRASENDQIYLLFSNGTRHLYDDRFGAYEWYYGKEREY